MTDEIPRTATYEWRQRREEALTRDSNTCQDCGVHQDETDSGTLHVHHKTPVAKGGSDALDNLVTLCIQCHRDRHPNRGVETPPSTADRDRMVKIDVRVPNTLLDRFDAERERRGYTSRPPAVRDALQYWADGTPPVVIDDIADLRRTLIHPDE